MTAALAERPQFYPARPTISVAGRRVPELAAALSEMVVTETLAGLYSLEATFGNWGTKQGSVGFLYFDRALFDFGAEIGIEIGAGRAEASIFKGRITALEGRFPTQRPPEVRILAEDRLQDLRMTRRTRTFESLGTSEIISRIAGDHGLTPQLDIDSIQYATVAQVNQSDLAFLRELARAVDAVLIFDDGTLHVQSRSRHRSEEIELVSGQTLREVAITADLAHQRTTVTVTGWDPSGKSAINEEARDNAVRGELDDGESGASILQQKFGARAEQHVHRMPLTSDEARAQAQAQFRAAARRFVTARGVAEGDARIRAGARVKLRELGPLFNGVYYVIEARHVFDGRNGYRTTFTADRPGLGRV